MSVSEDLIDFDIIESQKENIQSLPGGRSAKTLASLFSPSPLQQLSTPTPSDTKNLNDAIRQEYETELFNISESDDPLDIYDRYVRWTLDAYPSAQATSQSQLLPLLERATKAFLNSSQYKNDPRYLKLWLTYIRLFSDTPRETFAFLSRHNIGDGLALLYEEFASWLEGAGRWAQAEEVYKLGIEREARPAPRLLRKYTEFQQRFAQQPNDRQEPSSPVLPTVRPALAAKIDPFASSSSPPIDPQAPRQNSGLSTSSTSRSSRAKLAIFSDTEAATPVAISGSDGTKGWESIGSIAERRKENTIEPKPWAGETLKAGGKKSSAPKMAVFKDQSLPQSIITQSIYPMQEQVTKNPRSGRHERIFVNLEAVYPTPELDGTELSFEELQAQSRGWLNKSWECEKVCVPAQEERESSSESIKDEDSLAEADVGYVELDDKNTTSPVQVMLDENGRIKEASREGRSRKMRLMEVNETQMIKTKLSSPSGKKLKRKASTEQTMTFHTRAATDDIYDLFNQPLQSSMAEELEEESDQDDGDETDGDYTSGGESTGTGRLVTTSEAGDDETSDVKSISEWSDFTAHKHIPALDDDDDDEDTRASHVTDDDQYETGPSADEVEARNSTQEQILAPAPNEPKLPATRTTFIPIPPEDSAPPTRPFRNAAQTSQNRLPFMTPIAEKTESSLGASTSREQKDYFNFKTPSKENGPSVSSFHVGDPGSSPFQEIVNDSRPRERIAQPILSRVTKTTKTAPLSVKLDEPIAKETAPKGPIIKDAQCNPVDDYTRNMIFQNLQPPLSSYEGFFDRSDESLGRTAELKKFAKAVAKMGKSSSDKTTTNIAMPPVLRFPGTERQYMVRRELGAGAFAPVYLIENVADDVEANEDEVPTAMMGKGNFDHLGRKTLEALKMEDPPTAWEFYIMRQAKRRLGVSRAADSIINVYELHLYQDECYLIEQYRDQGTLLDLVNIARADSTAPGGVMDELLAMFFTIELLRTVEALHSKGLLHGDLKADNCLVRLDPISDTEVWTPRYRRDGSGGWSHKGLALIDFGRGIDMRLFRPDVAFIADWKTSPQDCAEMRELRPWTFHIDYHGLAGIVHSLLFGKYIDTVAVADHGAVLKLGGGAAGVGGRTYRIKESLKRYWQVELWSALFELLLNPGAHVEGEEGARLPVLRGMRGVRERMEEWVEGNCERGVGLQGAIRRLEGVVGQGRRK